MKNIVKHYRTLTYKEKLVFMTMFSIVLNFILAIGKIILSFFNGVFFLVAGIVNILILISKLQCYLGVKKPNKKSFKYRNNMISIFLSLAGIEYGIYMARLVFTDVSVMDYSAWLSINIALVSFVEMGFAIYGCFKTYGIGHYYRNIKLINMCSALTAMCLTEVALTSFASEVDTRVIDGILGMSVGFVIVLIALFIYLAPIFSIVDKEYNVYKKQEKSDTINTETIEIKLTNSKFYGDYLYVGKVKDDIIEGHIVKGKTPIWKYNIYIKITMIVLSEILIFPYAIGALVFYFKNYKVIDKLDKIMENKGYKKIKNYK